MDKVREEAKGILRAQDWQQFILAIIVVIGGGYALVFTPNTAGDVRLAIAGFMGAVITYFFGRSVGTQAAATMARTMNGYAQQTIETTSTPREVTTTVTPAPRPPSPEA